MDVICVLFIYQLIERGQERREILTLACYCSLFLSSLPVDLIQVKRTSLQRMRNDIASERQLMKNFCTLSHRRLGGALEKRMRKCNVCRRCTLHNLCDTTIRGNFSRMVIKSSPPLRRGRGHVFLVLAALLSPQEDLSLTAKFAWCVSRVQLLLSCAIILISYRVNYSLSI